MRYRRFLARIRVFGPAIVGALIQLMALAIVTVAFYLLARARFFASEWPLAICAENTSCESAALLLRLSYLLTAIGVALTDHRLITRTTLWAQQASRATSPNRPKFSTEAVAVQLSIVTVACVVEELVTPSQFIVALGQSIAGMWFGAILWPAIWSITIAASGSMVYALYLSMQPMSADRP